MQGWGKTGEQTHGGVQVGLGVVASGLMEKLRQENVNPLKTPDIQGSMDNLEQRR